MDLFHIYLYGPLQDEASAGPRQGNAIPTSFEAASDRLLAELPQLLLEPDGSLAWADAGYQIVGMMYDAAARIQYVELRGRLLSTAARSLDLATALRRLIETLVGNSEIDDYAVMVLPERQWKIFQSFETSLRSIQRSHPKADGS